MADKDFIGIDDYLYQIRRERLDQILEATDEDEDVMLDSAESEALAIIRKFLSRMYDLNVEFAKSGDDRNKVLLRWAKVLVIYFIYERIPDEMVPKRVIKNYDEVMEMLERIENGKAEVPGLAVILTPDNNEESRPYTRRRMGSMEARSNNPANMRDFKQ